MAGADIVQERREARQQAKAVDPSPSQSPAIRHSLQLSAITKRDHIITRPGRDHLAVLSW
jgi:hypothetical protein